MAQTATIEDLAAFAQQWRDEPFAGISAGGAGFNVAQVIPANPVTSVFDTFTQAFMGVQNTSPVTILPANTPTPTTTGQTSLGQQLNELARLAGTGFGIYQAVQGAKQSAVATMPTGGAVVVQQPQAVPSLSGLPLVAGGSGDGGGSGTSWVLVGLLVVAAVLLAGRRR